MMIKLELKEIQPFGQMSGEIIYDYDLSLN